MAPANPRILTINGGSSSIKFALFETGDALQRILDGAIERIGLPDATLRVKGLDPADNLSRLVAAPDHAVAVDALMDWIEERCGHDALTAIGHRVVHGGPNYYKPAANHGKNGWKSCAASVHSILTICRRRSC